MKKTLTIYLFLMLASDLFAQSVFVENGISYKIISENTVEVTENGGLYKGDINIPSTIIHSKISYNVTSIGDYAFTYYSYNHNANRSFEDNTALKTITLPNSITNIGDFAFYRCTRLKTIIIPNNVKSIEYQVFSGCTNLTNVVLSENLKSIGNASFLRCINLTSVTIPESVTSIGWEAFNECTNLSSINLTESVTSIGQYAFNSTAWLNNQPYGGIYINNILYSYKESYSNGTIFNIKDGTTSINDGAFSDCSFLTSIIIPTSVTSIGTYAFSKCTSLNSITIPNSVKSIGEFVFNNCTALNTITIPSSITAIPNDAFYSSGLNSIIIPGSVTSIGHGAFSGCFSLTDISLPNSIISIDKYAFDFCTSLTSIVLPNSISTISLGTFADCSKLTSINMPESITSIEEDAFKNCSALDSILIPENVSTIGKKAFEGTAWYNKQADGIVYIKKVLYKYKGYIQTDSLIIVKDATTSISEEAFLYCNQIKSIILPSSMNNIGNLVFFLCDNIQNITVNAISPPNTLVNTFLGFDYNIPIYVPVESLLLYKTADNWKDFNNIIGISEYKNKKVNMVPTIVENGFHINGLDECATLRLTDLNGKIIITKFIVNDEYISINWLPKGIYLLSITTIEGLNKFKFIKY